MWSCTSCQDTSSVILRNVRAKTLKFGRRCLNLHENTSRETGIKYVQQLYSAGPDTAYRCSVFLAGLNLSQIWAPFGQREPSAGPGHVLVLVRSWFNLRPSLLLPRQTMADYVYSFSSVVPGFACMYWHPNMTRPRTTFGWVKTH